MTGLMKAINTSYNGYFFRSRLEARWAVFFDSINIKWVYESEGFDLGREWYLPDFLLPDLDLWVEIKPERPTGREVGLAVRLAEGHASRWSPRSTALILAGDCWPGDYEVFCCMPDSIYENQLVDGERWDLLAYCRKCHGLGLLADNDTTSGCMEVGRHTCGGHERWPLKFDIRHYAAARSARFEHSSSH